MIDPILISAFSVAFVATDALAIQDRLDATAAASLLLADSTGVEPSAALAVLVLGLARTQHQYNHVLTRPVDTV